MGSNLKKKIQMVSLIMIAFEYFSTTIWRKRR